MVAQMVEQESFKLLVGGSKPSHPTKQQENEMKRFYSQHSGYGPGGRNCPCCGPAPKTRKVHDRIVKHREKRIVRKTIQKEIDAI